MKKNNEKIHVLYILTKLELGGAQKVCLSLMNGLKKSGALSSLIAGDQGVLVDQVKRFDSVFLLKSFKREIGFKNLFNELRAFFGLIIKTRSLKKKYPNLIVHTHSTKAGILGRWAAFFSGVKIRIHTVHGFAFHDHQSTFAWFIIYFLEYITAFVTTHYVCVSEYDRDIGKKRLPGFGKKSSVIHAAVDWDRFFGATKTDTFEEKFIIGTVSCFKMQKNIFDLLKAFKSMCNNVSDQNILLQIIGDGVLRTDIENWIEQNNMTEKIQLLGWQYDVSKWMKNWKIFALSSLWEGLPCAIVEARLSRLPVVSYNIAGIPEVIFDGKNGFLVEPGEWKNLANKMEQLLKDENLLQQMSSYNDDLNAFNDKHMVEQHLHLYNKQVIKLNSTRL